METEEKPKKIFQPATNNPPVIVAKPGGSEPGTKLRLLEEYQGERKKRS